MLTKTTETGLRTLAFLALRPELGPLSPREIAAALNTSPTYTAKVTAALVRAGILRAHKGVHGGVTLAREPAEITLLAAVEALQGKLLANYCTPTDQLQLVCGFHRAMHELHECVIATLSRYTLAELMAKPEPDPPLRGAVPCILQGCARLRG